MPQIFHRSSNTVSRVSLFGAIFFIAALLVVLGMLNRSPYFTQAGVVREQPVPFSHAHHVGGLGIDCRYCHGSVEDSSFAGLPPTSTCMTCHSQVWSDAAVLAPVRESARTGKPIEWTRVHDLPDFVYFDHSIHVKKGVACVTCHGPVNEMPLTWRKASLNMEWCLECHRSPEKYIGPAAAVFQTNLEKTDSELQEWLVKENHVKKMTNCSTCHR
jgi:hypothetical protein